MGKFKLFNLNSIFWVPTRNTLLGVVLILVCLSFSGLLNLKLSNSVNAQDYETYWTSVATAPTYGDGLTVNTAYLITSPYELAWVSKKTNEGTNWSYNLHIMLGANIDLAGHKWEPIGNFNTATFSSVFYRTFLWQ